MDFSAIMASIVQIASELAGLLVQNGMAHIVPVVEAATGGSAEKNVVVVPLLKTALTFLTGFALVFGVGLALVARFFNTKTDPKVEKAEELLAHAHCGACGFAGCHQYAEAVVNDPAVAPTLCTPAGKAASVKLAALTGKQVGEVEERIAFVACRGDTELSKIKFEHRGVPDCVAAAAVAGGDKECPYGCLGYGSCVAACPFEAITLNKNDMPEIDPKKCVACGLCAKACPRKIISIVPKNRKPIVKCTSGDKGITVKRYCEAGCISCGICVKYCPSEAITMIKNVVKIDPGKCTDCGLCETKCPRKIIVRMPV